MSRKTIKLIAQTLVVATIAGWLTACSPLLSGQKPDNQNSQQAAFYNVQLGLAYMQQNETVQAKEKLLLAQQQAPQSPVVLDALGYYFEATGDPRLAERYYRGAIAQAPKSGQVLNNYGVFLCRIGRFRQAENYLLAAAHDETYVKTAAAFENAGLCELAVPNVALAEKYFLKALKQDSTLATSLYELGKIYYDKGRYNLANTYIKRYNQTQPVNADALWLSIRIAHKLGDFDTVAIDAKKLRTYFPKSKQYSRYRKMQTL